MTERDVPISSEIASLDHRSPRKSQEIVSLRGTEGFPQLRGSVEDPTDGLKSLTGPRVAGLPRLPLETTGHYITHEL